LPLPGDKLQQLQQEQQQQQKKVLETMSCRFLVGTSLLFKAEEGRRKTKWREGTVSAVIPKEEEKKDSDEASPTTTYEITLEGTSSRSNSSSSNNITVQACDLEWMVLAKTYKDQPIAKDFGNDLGGIYRGVVVDIFRLEATPTDPTMILFQVEYADGDKEDLELLELEQAIQLHANTTPTSRFPNTKKPMSNIQSAKAGKKRKMAGYKTTGLSDEDDDIETNDTEKQIEHRKRRQRTTPLEKPEEELVSRYGRRRRSSVQSYKEPDSEDDDEEESDQEPKPRAKKKPKRASSRARKAIRNDDDESPAMYGSEESENFLVDSEEEDDHSAELQEASDHFFRLMYDDTDDLSEEDSDSLEVATTTTTRRKKTATTGNKRKSSSNRKKAPKKDSAAVAPKKKLLKDSFEPINRPLYPKLSLNEIKETKQFLDPCGQEATDDIISMLVGEQVDKIQLLLQRALDANDHLGSQHMPLKLGTACSGTDAPALALTLVQEQLALRGLQKLEYDHKFSCEVEPFKQAYLARNFDSLLYPDICKLTDQVPKDAYGQPQPIPDYNLFVAGTSCKNFSMLRANKRLDIEDKGCSGETFLAAIEHMLDKKPPFCIFENVLNAPWYVAGMVAGGCVDRSISSSAQILFYFLSFYFLSFLFFF
jgi:hypothetical protein